jgi:hypothetical protein
VLARQPTSTQIVKVVMSEPRMIALFSTQECPNGRFAASSAAELGEALADSIFAPKAGDWQRILAARDLLRPAGPTDTPCFIHVWDLCPGEDRPRITINPDCLISGREQLN